MARSPVWVLGHLVGSAALAMLGGALSFVPYVGTIAMIVGALAALPQGIDFAVYTLIVFGAASFFEGYLIMPYIRARRFRCLP